MQTSEGDLQLRQRRNGHNRMSKEREKKPGKTEKKAGESDIGELKEGDCEDMSYGQSSESMKGMDVNVYIH